MALILARPAEAEDILKVSFLEKGIEKENAANFETLKERFLMFPDGFRVVKARGQIFGYIESCRWNLEADEIETFKQIKNFPNLHRKNGKNLYIIFVGVDERYRKTRIGSSLVENLCDYSKKSEIKEIQLVARNDLINFYKRLGFDFVRELPNFLPYSAGTAMKRMMM